MSNVKKNRDVDFISCPASRAYAHALAANMHLRCATLKLKMKAGTRAIAPIPAMVCQHVAVRSAFHQRSNCTIKFASVRSSAKRLQNTLHVSDLFHENSVAILAQW
jgi:hypothetical protein